MSEPVHVLVLAGDADRRASFEAALGEPGAIDVVRSSDPAGIEEAIAGGYPDVVVLHAGPSELAAARAMARKAVATRFVAVLEPDRNVSPDELLDSNIGAVVRTVGELPDAVRGLARGEGFLDADLARHVLDRHREGRIAPLSSTEEEVLGRIADGVSVAAIADEYAVPERLVRLHAGGPLARLFTA